MYAGCARLGNDRSDKKSGQNRLYFSKIQDDSFGIIAQILCIMPSFHKPNLTDIIGCVVCTKMSKLAPESEMPLVWPSTCIPLSETTGHLLPSPAWAEGTVLSLCVCLFVTVKVTVVPLMRDHLKNGLSKGVCLI